MSVSSLEPATPSSRRAGRRVRSQSRASATSVETGITTGGAAGSVADDELPEFDDEQDLGGDDDDNAVLQEDEDEGEELFGDNMEAYELIVSLLCFWFYISTRNLFENRDYRAIPALDRYDGEELDESDYDAISESGRREAERAMRKRDQEMGVGDMRRGLFYG